MQKKIPKHVINSFTATILPKYRTRFDPRAAPVQNQVRTGSIFAPWVPLTNVLTMLITENPFQNWPISDSPMLLMQGNMKASSLCVWLDRFILADITINPDLRGHVQFYFTFSTFLSPFLWPRIRKHNLYHYRPIRLSAHCCQQAFRTSCWNQAFIEKFEKLQSISDILPLSRKK